MPDNDTNPSESGTPTAGPPDGIEGPGLRRTLANERTLLAWFRTALALLAASFAVVKLADITPHGLRLAMGWYLVALATGVITAGYVQWRIRQARIPGPDPADRGLGALALTVSLFLLAGFVVAVIVIAP